MDLENVWLGNRIWPSRANLAEWGWDLIGSSLLIRGCERIVLQCPWQTVRLLWWKRPSPSQPVLPISAVPPFSLTAPPPPQSSLPPPPALFPTPLVSPLTTHSLQLYPSPRPSLLSFCCLVHGQITAPAAPCGSIALISLLLISSPCLWSFVPCCCVLLWFKPRVAVWTWAH